MTCVKRLFVLSLVISLQCSAQQRYDTTWASIDSRPIPAWFTDAKFGIFIHWGVYSVPAWGPVGKEYPVYSKYAEWYWNRLVADSSKTGDAFRNYHMKTYGPNFRYQDFANNFKAELFNPAQWADVFKASGAKYVVLTSKHHEGFTLWPSTESWNWNSVDVGPHRDLAGDLIKAVKAKGLKMGFYYSMYEWFNPLYYSDLNRYVDQHMLPQMKDLVMRYHPDVVWPDGEWEHPSSTWKSTQFLSWLYNESPVKNDVVVNDRWGSETRGKHGGYYTTEYDLVGDQDVKGKKISHPWEECRGIGFSFGYNRNESLEDYQSSESLVHTLIEKVSKGGNLLLDIGPAADGTIPVIMQQRLIDIGNWLKINGDAIYGTREWEKAPAAKKENTLYFTRKGKDLYAIVTKFPTAPFIIENIKQPSSVSLLGSSAKVKWSSNNGRLTIDHPVVTPAENKVAYAWVFLLKDVL